MKSLKVFITLRFAEFEERAHFLKNRAQEEEQQIELRLEVVKFRV